MVLMATLAGGLWFTSRQWQTTVNWVDPVKFQEANAAAAYLSAAHVPASRPVVFVVDDRGPQPSANVSFMRDHVYAMMPVARDRHVYVYMGSPENYLARHPTALAGNVRYTNASRRYFRLIGGTYGQDPVALIGFGFNVAHYEQWAAAHPESVIPGQQLAVVRGPAPLGALSIPPTAIGPQSMLKLVLIAVAVLGLLGLVGLGWARVLIGGWLDSVELAAVAPAFGIAFLVIAGVAVDRVGVRLEGLPGAMVLVGTGVIGWALVFVRRHRARAAAGTG